MEVPGVSLNVQTPRRGGRMLSTEGLHMWNKNERDGVIEDVGKAVKR